MLRGVNVIFEKSDAIQIRVFFIRGESQNQGIVTPSVFYFTGCQIDPHVMTGTHLPLSFLLETAMPQGKTLTLS